MNRLLKPNFLALHYAYFILTCMIGSVIIYMTSTQIYSIHYADALFMSISAMTGTGLSVVDLSTQNVYQQATLFVLMLLGHAIPISGVVLLYRRRNLHQIIKASAMAKLTEGVSPHTMALESQTRQLLEDKCRHLASKDAGEIVCSKTVPEIAIEMKEDPPGYLSHPDSGSLPLTVVSVMACPDKQSRWHGKITHLPAVGSRFTTLVNYISKRSHSFHLDEPAVVAAKAVQLLSFIVFVYFAVILLLGVLVISIWLKLDLPNIATAYNVAPSWAGAFLATSAFSNNGMSLIDANMIPFQQEWFPLLALSGLILAGSALYPCFLRTIIWSLGQALPTKGDWGYWRRIFDFTLFQSQNLYPYFFSAWQTWFLLGINLMLNGIMWGAFELFPVAVTEPEALSAEYRALDGLFQALAVRGGGFCVVAFDKLPQGLLVLYLLMMYISAFPVSVTISKKDLAEVPLEKIPPSEDERHAAPRGKGIFKWAYCCYLYEQFRSQLSHDLWWISLAVICITVAEADHYRLAPINYSTFNIIFEVVSAYSCVGVSVGYPGKTYSFCGEWHTFSKLVLAGIAIQGRHRGFPLATDNTHLLQEAHDWVQSRSLHDGLT